jgi:DeoR family fructose operon transcriptional repressor
MENSTASTHLFAEERQQKIVELLHQSQKMTVSDLCTTFNVSPSTIRNDLQDLENRGLLKRTHGGAILNLKTKFEPNFSQKQVDHFEEKQAIGKYAADLIEEGDTVILDTGTSIFEIAKNLKGRKNITVVTNDIGIASFLEQNSELDIILVGGTLRRGLHCTVGPIATENLHNLIVDKAFLGTNGISLKNGLMTPEINTAEVKKVMAKIASEIYLICDSSKFGHNGFIKVLPITSIDHIITDSNISPEIAENMRNAGIDFEIVPLGPADTIDGKNDNNS